MNSNIEDYKKLKEDNIVRLSSKVELILVDHETLEVENKSFEMVEDRHSAEINDYYLTINSLLGKVIMNKPVNFIFAYYNEKGHRITGTITMVDNKNTKEKTLIKK